MLLRKKKVKRYYSDIALQAREITNDFRKMLEEIDECDGLSPMPGYDAETTIMGLELSFYGYGLLLVKEKIYFSFGYLPDRMVKETTIMASEFCKLFKGIDKVGFVRTILNEGAPGSLSYRTKFENDLNAYIKSDKITSLHKLLDKIESIVNVWASEKESRVTL